MPILPITFPGKINNFVTGFEYFMFSQNFLFVEDSFNWFKDIVDIDKGQMNYYLYDIGAKYESTLINISTILKLVLLILLLNLIYMLIYNLLVKNRITDDSKIKKVHDYVSSILHYNIYVRIYMSIFMILVLSIFFEIDKFNTSTSSLFISIAFGVMVVLSVIFFTIHWVCSNFNDEELKPQKVKELYIDVKPKKLASVYKILELIRIVILSCIVAFGQRTNSKTVVSLFIGITGLFCLYFIIFRPFNGAKENILQTIDETILIVLLLISSIIEFFSSWNTTKESIYIGIVIGTN
jgi:hypothetical protein